MKYATLLLVALLGTSAAQAQNPQDVCMVLAQSGLVDTRQIDRTIEITSEQFRNVCANKEQRVARYKSSSVAAKAKYKVFSASYGKGNIESENQEEIDQMCDIGESNFGSFIRETFSESIGRHLASEVVRCFDILTKSNVEALFGTVRVNESDNRFVLDIFHSQGKPPNEYSLVALVHDNDPNDVKCTLDSGTQGDSIPIANLLVKGSTAVACTKKPGVSVQGALVLEGVWII